MNLDLTQLNAFLAQLGPWGIVIAVVLTVAAPRILAWVKATFPNLKLPAAPAAPAGPAAPLAPLNPADPLAGRPVLGLALSLLQQLLARNNPGQDVDQLLVNHLLGQVGTQVIVPVTAATAMSGPRLADRPPVA